MSPLTVRASRFATIDLSPVSRFGERFRTEATDSLAVIIEAPSTEAIFDGMEFQRLRLHHDQQISEWEFSKRFSPQAASKAALQPENLARALAREISRLLFCEYR
jgi:hypothetical protein